MNRRTLLANGPAAALLALLPAWLTRRSADAERADGTVIDAYSGMGWIPNTYYQPPTKLGLQTIRMRIIERYRTPSCVEVELLDYPGAQTLYASTGLLDSWGVPNKIGTRFSLRADVVEWGVREFRAQSHPETAVWLDGADATPIGTWTPRWVELSDAE